MQLLHLPVIPFEVKGVVWRRHKLPGKNEDCNSRIVRLGHKWKSWMEYPNLVGNDGLYYCIDCRQLGIRHVVGEEEEDDKLQLLAAEAQAEQMHQEEIDAEDEAEMRGAM